MDGLGYAKVQFRRQLLLSALLSTLAAIARPYSRSSPFAFIPPSIRSADAPSSDDEGSSRSFSSSSSKTTNSKNSPQSHLLRRDPSSGSDPSASDDALSLAVLLNSCLKPAPLQLHNADAADRSNCSSTTGGHSPTAPRPAHRKRKSPSPQPRGVQQTWTLLLFLLFCMIISSASFSLLAPILPEEAPARGVSGLRLGSIFSADQLVCVIFVSP